MADVLLNRSAIVEIMSSVELLTPAIAVHYRNLTQNSVLAGHASHGSSYVLRYEGISHPGNGTESKWLVLTLLHVDDKWRFGGIAERHQSPALVGSKLHLLETRPEGFDTVADSANKATLAVMAAHRCLIRIFPVCLTRSLFKNRDIQ